MSKFIRIKHSIGKGRPHTLQGIKFKFFIAKSKEKTEVKLCLHLGGIIKYHLKLRSKSKLYVTFASKNNFELKIKKCKKNEYGYTLEHENLKKEDILKLSFAWVTCKIPLKWTLMQFRTAKYKLYEDSIIINITPEI